MSEVFCNPLHYVEVMKHKYAYTLTDWCCTELSHVLEFNGPEGLGQILAGNVNVRQGKTIIKKFTKPKKKVYEPIHTDTGIFGAPLTSQAFCQTRQLIDFLRMNSSKEGLFRIPGNSERQRRLKAKLNSGQLIDLNNDEFTAHDVACVLKTFLGDLPEPVLTEKHYLAHVQAADLTYRLDGLSNLRPDELQRLKAKRLVDHIKALTYLFLMLPSTNFKLLKELLELLQDVARQQDVNKMTAYNLGVMFAPHLLWPRYLTTEELKDQDFIHKLNCGMEFMITHCERIFKVPAAMLHKCEVYVRHDGSLPDEEDEEELMNQTARDQYDGGRRSTDMISAPQKAGIELKREVTSTEEALAKLYADVQSMPESSKKRKLMKQFTKNSYLPGTPTRVREEALKQSRHRSRHTRSKSLGEVMIKVGTPFASKKKRPAPPPPADETEVSRTHNTNREIRNEFRTQLHQSRHHYRKRANSCDALESRTETRDVSQRRSSPTKPVRPAPRTPEPKASPRPVPAPRAITPKLATGITHRNEEGRSANPSNRPTVTPRPRKRNSDGQPIPSPRDTTNIVGSGNRPVPKPRVVNNLAKENNPLTTAPRVKRESAL
ncbi:rho GTPase-activating protein 19-like [Amphiura filiformis]|uniref:rho GTPase-activating protein 19-like n=1 Tax=Amphiura filiformis TaxID=82378 RepID=UPI003B22148D